MFYEGQIDKYRNFIQDEVERYLNMSIDVRNEILINCKPENIRTEGKGDRKNESIKSKAIWEKSPLGLWRRKIREKMKEYRKILLNESGYKYRLNWVGNLSDCEFLNCTTV